MAHDARYDVLFEGVKIGPVTTKNRFYQVPHCNGMGHRYPRAIAASRAVKAEGGWSVISTEECEIHPSSDVSPYIEARLWDEGDMERLALSVDAIHQHDALAAVELAHNGHHSLNRYSRLPTMGVSDMMVGSYDPQQAYAMSKKDIADVRQMHVDAAIRARDIGFDIIYCYAGHDLTLGQHFISRRHNKRTDEYGGSLENRVRFFREIIDATKSAVGDRCAIAVRFAVDELLGEDGIVSSDEGKDIVHMLAELPDLWDVNVADWANDSLTARFGEEGSQEKYTAFVKGATTKPVVGVGRFTSPDAMVSQIRRGILDLIGAARPSIADPFLPNKIEQGQLDDIRECIGCNICVSSDMLVQPLRCTQNPTTAEEYRRGWHPEKISSKHADEHIFIVGAGPAGLEAAMSLGRRGYDVTISEALSQAGGRALIESSLPGLSTWKRVVDYRLGQIEKLPNVNLYLESTLDADQAIEFSQELGVEHIVTATGSSWRSDGIGRTHFTAIKVADDAEIHTPEDVWSNSAQFENVKGGVVIYDDDLYYLGSVLAERLVELGTKVTVITPAPQVAQWTENTLEQQHIERRLFSHGVEILPSHTIREIKQQSLTLNRNNQDGEFSLEAEKVILVTSRNPENQLYHQLASHEARLRQANIPKVTRIGDCLAPSTIASAVYEGHRFAQEYEIKPDPHRIPFKREVIQIND